MKQVFIRRFWPCYMLLALLLAACSTSQAADNNLITSIKTDAQVQIPLVHDPVGTAILTWQPDHTGNDTGTLKVTVSVTGLAPSSPTMQSTHPEHIHMGTCASNPMGPIIYKLNPLVADTQGRATRTTVIPGVKNGIPAHGWYVNIHNGPQLDPKNATDLQNRAITCGTVSNTRTQQTVHVALVTTMDPDEAVSGTASIRISGHKVVIDLIIHGLISGSIQKTHMAHIHAGTCQSQGSVVYSLNPVLVDTQGNGKSETTITPKSIQNFTTSLLYINVHEAATMNGLTTQTGFNPIACGNIPLRLPSGSV
jgi:hypothetical protein